MPNVGGIKCMVADFGGICRVPAVCGVSGVNTPFDKVKRGAAVRISLIGLYICTLEVGTR